MKNKLFKYGSYLKKTNRKKWLYKKKIISRGDYIEKNLDNNKITQKN